MGKVLDGKKRVIAIDDMKKFLGRPPYDSDGNISKGDGYFALSIEEKYGLSIMELKEELNKELELEKGGE